MKKTYKQFLDEGRVLEKSADLVYLDMIYRTLKEGYLTKSRNAEIICLPGQSATYYLKNNTLPVLFSKKVFISSVVKELFWFLSGDTTRESVREFSLKIWDLWMEGTFKEDLGRIYPYQWRSFSGEIDQIENLVLNIEQDPFSRRHLVTNWNPKDIPHAALPSCHVLYQCHVLPDDQGRPKYLWGQMYQRSGDLAVGVPFNILSYSLLTHWLANTLELEALYFTHNIGNAHIYTSHVEGLCSQLNREYLNGKAEISFHKNVPLERMSPKEYMNINWRTIDKNNKVVYQMNDSQESYFDIRLHNVTPHPFIPFEVYR